MEDEFKPCPLCGEQILAVAKKCRHCRAYLDPTLKAEKETPSDFERLAMPVGRPTSAIIAGYAALFAIIPLFGLPAAVAATWCGFAAKRKIEQTPGLVGLGRAWFGIVVGSVMLLIDLVFCVIFVIALAQGSP